MAQTQNQRMKEYLENGHKLTPLEALNLFGCFRLASRISDLKRQGMNIKTEMVTDSNTGKQYASYSLVIDVPIECLVEINSDGELF